MYGIITFSSASGLYKCHTFFFFNVCAFKLKPEESLLGLSECFSSFSLLLLEKLLFWTWRGLGLCAGTLGFA